MKVCTVGLGYIGLPTAAMLASRGHEVVGLDVNERVVAAVNSGQAHFQEPDLQMLLSAAVDTKRLRATTQPEPAEFFLIAVPTPMVNEGPDMTFVEAAARTIAPVLEKGNVVILESTSPVGSTERLAEIFAEERPDLTFPRYRDEDREADVALCHCPERILPGQMLRELVSNDRIIGGLTTACAQKAARLYQTFVMGTCYITDARVAELCKLSENAYRDVNIAFANELSIICDKLGTDVWQVRELANQHPRVNILMPGAGVGGHCIAVDPWFIVSSAPEEARLIRTARLVNDDKPHRVVAQVRRLADKFKVPKVACYGITYKPDVDDVRESPALEIVEAIADIEGAEVLVVEPNLDALPPALACRANVRHVTSDEAREAADIVTFLVGHRQFRRLEADSYLAKAVVDTTGMFSTRKAKAAELD
ncbi:UDP-N-acetyl-D-mannosamine dehydrogenase [Erythrobacter arachoides]|uniref:UDP-N-acetyl-D-mannosamine dehydrogenase n=1 Tax=Aurantiacibacter arachoides TaxID=1850444 RepID=A0A844ZYM7_9SPHN|nr:UDP-N-acetyl-D-mannosamine dehydrogenase [Aurantiacibacter arachoides]MXO93391.1 UDP-N-acetyl-D-mannosamine dehydrogenase [Aurantiacibacter arachoides]GGD49722.1 UDP-N-acetyl-D-mannosamine dehydrogenase [Aurantiacibacter arachoides]